MPSFMLTNNFRRAERGRPASFGEIGSQTKIKTKLNTFYADKIATV